LVNDAILILLSLYTIKIYDFLKIQHGRWPPFWKIEKSPYLSNGLTDRSNFWLKNKMADGLCPDYSTVNILKAT